MLIDPAILDFYNQGREQDRLRDPLRSIEYHRTMDVLHRFLPPAPAAVLDVGGGPGAYALSLAALGYQVHLLDPVPLHATQAKVASDEAEHPLAGISVGDARHLPYADASADVVLLLGPLYHLTTAADRQQAWREARRVLRPDGLVVAAGASRYYTTWEMLSKGLLSGPEANDTVQRHITTGQHRNRTRDGRLWTTAYFHDPDELAAEATTAGFEVQKLLAVEGPAKLLPGLADLLQQDISRRQLLSAIGRLESQPSVLGLSSHVLVIAHRVGAVRPRSMDPGRANELIHAISTWIDTSPSNVARDREALLWSRVAKVAEESGEAITALVGATGSNPRKGCSATMQKVEDELLDTAAAALAAVAHLHAGAPEPADLMGLLARKIEAIARRASLI